MSNLEAGLIQFLKERGGHATISDCAEALGIKSETLEIIADHLISEGMLERRDYIAPTLFLIG